MEAFCILSKIIIVRGWVNPFSISSEIILLMTGWNFSVDFFNNESPVVYSFDYAEMILSYTEYKLDGHSLEKPELTWKSIYSEWSYDDSDLSYRLYLEQNFEPPVRKCK